MADNGARLVGGLKPRIEDADGNTLPWPESVGFKLSGLSAPHLRWRDIAAEVEAADSIEKRCVVANQILGTPFAEDDAVNPSTLPAHRADAEWTRREGEQVILSVAVQAERLIVLVTAWGPQQRCRMVEAIETHGPTDILTSGAWQGLQALMREYAPCKTFIDIGFRSQAVADFCRRSRAVPVRGSSSGERHPEFRLAAPDRQRGGMRTLYFGVDKLKNSLTRRLAVEDPAAGDYWTFPHDWSASECGDFVAEERRLRRNPRGRLRLIWRQIKDQNHVWDCGVYALGAFLWLKSLSEGRRVRRYRDARVAA